MKNKNSKRLNLSKETIKRLSEHDLTQVVGGNLDGLNTINPDSTANLSNGLNALDGLNLPTH